MVDTSSIIPAAIYAQEKGPMAKAVNVAATSPENEKQFLEEIASAVLKKKSEHLNQADNVGEKEGDAGGGSFAYFNVNDEKQDDKPEPSDNPLVGNLLNVKI